ncbi:putative RiPP precursor [Mesorhizobium marinum]
MKKSYEKPVLARREMLTKIAAGNGPGPASGQLKEL